MSEDRPKRSDQLPEEGPAEQVPEDADTPRERSGDDEATQPRSGEDPQGQASGNPANAG